MLIIPHAGGGPSYYRSLAAALPAHVEGVLVLLPGRESRLREVPMRHMPAVIRELVPALESLRDRPLSVLGHSLGAIIAFEIARHSPHIERLIVAAARAPHLPFSGPRLCGMSDGQLQAELGRFGGTPETVLAHTELFSLFLPVLRADLEMFEEYEFKPGPKLNVPIRVMSGLADDRVPLIDLLPWRDLTSAGVELIGYPGGHFFEHDAGLGPMPTAELCVFPLEATDADEAHLNESELRRARQFLKPSLGNRFVAGRSRMRQILGRRLGLAPSDVPLSTSPAGKPQLAPGTVVDLRFNLAHSGDLGLFAVTEGIEVGVDLERHRKDVDFHGLAERYYAPGERAVVAAAKDVICTFFGIWSGKEAYSKARGLGLNLPLDSYEIALGSNGLAAGVTDLQTPGWQVHGVNAAEGFSAAVATKAPVAAWRIVAE
ncbi:MAG: alpha/beta fold hydrolase [Gemmataceae bacterium]|nr:alpha/beta fold hydrolase [Gemmataceae bacterium]